jgi:hypothetical protein
MPAGIPADASRNPVDASRNLANASREAGGCQQESRRMPAGIPVGASRKAGGGQRESQWTSMGKTHIFGEVKRERFLSKLVRA